MQIVTAEGAAQQLAASDGCTVVFCSFQIIVPFSSLAQTN